MLTNYTTKDLIIIDPQVNSKSELFEKMVNHLYNFDYVGHKKKFLQALLAREEIANTELMEGVALPHSRSEAVEKLFLSIVIHRQGIEYDNQEMGKAKIIFFFGTSEKFNKEYLQLLARSARILKNEEFRERLLACEKPEAVILLLDQFDHEEVGNTDIKTNFLMLLTLHQGQKTNDVLSSLVEMGVTNASIINIETLSSKISHDLPVFSSLYYDNKKKHKNSVLITCQISELSLASKLAKVLQKNGIDLTIKGNGHIQIIQSDVSIGNPEEDIEL